jgi:hypothetical protein
MPKRFAIYQKINLGSFDHENNNIVFQLQPNEPGAQWSEYDEKTLHFMVQDLLDMSKPDGSGSSSDSITLYNDYDQTKVTCERNPIAIKAQLETLLKVQITELIPDDNRHDIDITLEPKGETKIVHDRSDVTYNTVSDADDIKHYIDNLNGSGLITFKFHEGANSITPSYKIVRYFDNLQAQASSYDYKTVILLGDNSSLNVSDDDYSSFDRFKLSGKFNWLPSNEETGKVYYSIDQYIQEKGWKTIKEEDRQAHIQALKRQYIGIQLRELYIRFKGDEVVSHELLEIIKRENNLRDLSTQQFNCYNYNTELQQYLIKVQNKAEQYEKDITAKFEKNQGIQTPIVEVAPNKRSILSRICVPFIYLGKFILLPFIYLGKFCSFLLEKSGIKKKNSSSQRQLH